MRVRVRFSSLLLLFLSLLLLLACIQRRQADPPIAQTHPKTNCLHGVTWTDNYYWLKERENPEVMDYLEAENAYTEAAMEHTSDLQETLYKEMVAREKETDMSVPEKEGLYYYYERMEEGKQYPVSCRKKGSLEGEEEIILDQNLLAAGHDYFSIGGFEISADEQLLAYSIDTNGSEMYTIQFKNLTTGEVLEDEVPDTYYSFEWANDNRTVFYVVQDETFRPYKLMKHRLGSDVTQDEMIYSESDQAFEMNISKTNSKEYVLLELASNTTTEVRYLNANRPDDKFRVVRVREHEVEYSVYHHDSRFFIRTNAQAPNFKLMEVQVKNLPQKNWKEYISHTDSIMIENVDVFKNYMVVYERKNGLKQIRVIDINSGRATYVEFPESVYTYSSRHAQDFSSQTVRFTYQSMITPKTVYDYDMKSHTLEIKKQYEVLGGYNKGQYNTARIVATASDGTPVPITIAYKKGLLQDGTNPCLLYGYGSYGLNSDPHFSSTKLSLMDRGFVIAIAHVRGGSEMGRWWYDQGKMLNKRNTFTDFITCAEYMISEKYTSPGKLVINGVSAGGLLMGAVANMRPDLFTAIVAGVPFVDLMNTMLDPTIPLTVIEYEEWGNPNQKEYFDYMMSYSPYDNVSSQNYPRMLITAGLYDPRVQYWEPAKWTAKLRSVKTDKNLLLLKTNMGSGHFGATGRYDEYRETAFQFAFVLDAVGITK